MFKKFFIACLFLLPIFMQVNTVKAHDFTSHEHLPDRILIKEDWFSWTTTFSIETTDRKLGSVYRKLLSWTPEYDFYNNNDDHVAKGRMRFFSWTVVFDVTDAVGNKLGKVQEKPFTFFPSFEIVSPNGNIQAVARLNFWGTKYTIKSYDGVHFASMWRNFFRLKDDWKLDIYKKEIFHHKEIDPRMFILLAVFQTDRDYWRSIKNQEALALQSPNTTQLNKADLLAKLEPHRAELFETTPTEQECEELEKIVEEKLTAIEEERDQPNDLPVNEAEIVQDAIETLIELLDTDELTQGQKSALFLLLQEKLSK